LKARLLDIEVPDILRYGGVFNLDMLKECVKSKNYEQLPDVFKKAMNEIEQDLLREVDPLNFSAKIDCAMLTTSSRNWTGLATIPLCVITSR
jgi:hypothetical protein